MTAVVVQAPRLALSLIQPWAHCVIWLGKPVENRDWKWPPRDELLGQRIAIHASKTKPDLDTVEDLVDDGHVVPHELPLGAIVGSVRLRGWVRYSGGVSSIGRSSTLTSEDAQAAVSSIWWMGPLGLVLDQRLPYAEPIPAKGALGFWTPTPEDLVRVASREADALHRGFDPPQPHTELDDTDELGGGRRRDPSNPRCSCSELMRCESCVERVEQRRKGAADRARARAMFEAAGKPVPAWAREP